MPSIEDAPPVCIQEVWQENMEEEFVKIRQIVQEYPFIAMVIIDICKIYISAVYFVACII